MRDFLFAPGETVRERYLEYEVVSQVSRGGVSDIYEVKDADGVRNILKLGLPRRHVDDHNSTAYAFAGMFEPHERAVREIAFLNALNHPNIIKPFRLLHDLPDGLGGILMERLQNPIALETFASDLPTRWNAEQYYSEEGFDVEKKLLHLIQQYGHIFSPRYLLDDLIEEYDDVVDETSDTQFNALSDFLDQLRALYGGFLAQLVDASRSIGHEGIIHKDLVFTNVLIDGSATIKVADFGMSAFIGENLPWFSRRARPPEYATPCMGSDLWTIGSEIYRHFTGHYPLSMGNDPLEIAEQVAKLTSFRETHGEHVPFSGDVLKDFLTYLGSLFTEGRTYEEIYTESPSGETFLGVTGRVEPLDLRYQQIDNTAFKASRFTHDPRVFWVYFFNLDPMRRYFPEESTRKIRAWSAIPNRTIAPHLRFFIDQKETLVHETSISEEILGGMTCSRLFDPRYADIVPPHFLKTFVQNAKRL